MSGAVEVARARGLVTPPLVQLSPAARPTRHDSDSGEEAEDGEDDSTVRHSMSVGRRLHYGFALNLSPRAPAPASASSSGARSHHRKSLSAVLIQECTANFTQATNPSRCDTRESLHPHPAKCSYVGTVTMPGVSALRVTFDSRYVHVCVCVCDLPSLTTRCWCWLRQV